MGSAVPEYIGYICAGVAGLCFGSNFVPLKQYQTGDGLFFQWILCCAIFVVGFIVNACRNFPVFQPFAMLGGVLWCTGNVLTVPIVKCIGLSLGMLTWGLVNLVMGWASGAFGLFGLPADHIKTVWLNYLGAGLAVASIFVYVFIKPNESQAPRVINELHNVHSEKSLLVNSDDPIPEPVEDDSSWVDKLGNKKRVVGFGMAAVAGCFYGTNFVPPTYVIHHCGGTCSQNNLDYVFSHFTGIFLTSTTYLLIYCILMKNKPRVFPQIIFPGFISGTMWALAQVSWFVANGALSFSISFPIITVIPSVVATMWGVLVYKEIQGKRNILLLGLAFSITITAVILTALSQVL